ncbi:MAG: DUF3857 domain-containing protein [Deltaproteobacteria bacterium]|nr:DUF3857 domain-containing protein [Deltaproteobacteria bacterium]
MIDDEVIHLLEILPPDEFYPDASVIVVLDEKVDEVLAQRTCRSTLHTVFKVIKEGGKGYANVEIGYNSRRENIFVEYARTITPEGEILPMKDDVVTMATPYSNYPSYGEYKILTFSLPGIVVGSIIDYKVVIEKRRPTMEGEYASRFYFQGYEPAFLSRFKVIAPEDMDLRYYIRNPLKEFATSPKTYHEGGKKVFLWEYRNIPQIMPEYNMPPFSEIAFNIQGTTVRSWKDFFSWWNRLKDDKIEPDEAIREKVAELTGGLKDPGEKAEALFYYVETEIRYVSINLGKSGYEPTPAREVFENKYGDCKDKSTLLISMLKAAGVPAYYVLIPTRGVGRLIKDFPYPFQFNHCIVAIEGERKYQFLDPTGETYPFDYLPSEDQDRDALLFKGQQGIFTRTPLARPRENGVLYRQTIRIGPDGSIEVEKRSLDFGDVGAYNRATYMDCGPTELREIFEGAASALHPGAKLIDCSISDPFDFKRPFTKTYRFIAEDYCKRAGDLLIFQLPGVSYSCLTPVKEGRKYPIELCSVHFLRNEVEVDLPDGYGVYYLPKPVEIKTPYFDFCSSYRYEEGKIFYQGERIRKTTTIPLEDYPLYRKFCQEMERGSTDWVVLKKEKDFEGSRDLGTQGSSERQTL